MKLTKVPCFRKKVISFSEAIYRGAVPGIYNWRYYRNHSAARVRESIKQICIELLTNESFRDEFNEQTQGEQADDNTNS